MHRLKKTNLKLLNLKAKRVSKSTPSETKKPDQVVKTETTEATKPIQEETKPKRVVKADASEPVQTETKSERIVANKPNPRRERKTSEVTKKETEASKPQQENSSDDKKPVHNNNKQRTETILIRTRISSKQ